MLAIQCVGLDYGKHIVLNYFEEVTKALSTIKGESNNILILKNKCEKEWEKLKLHCAQQEALAFSKSGASGGVTSPKSRGSVSPKPKSKYAGVKQSVPTKTSVSPAVGAKRPESGSRPLSITDMRNDRKAKKEAEKQQRAKEQSTSVGRGGKPTDMRSTYDKKMIELQRLQEANSRGKSASSAAGAESAAGVKYSLKNRALAGAASTAKPLKSRTQANQIFETDNESADRSRSRSLKKIKEKYKQQQKAFEPPVIVSGEPRPRSP